MAKLRSTLRKPEHEPTWSGWGAPALVALLVAAAILGMVFFGDRRQSFGARLNESGRDRR